MGDSDAFRERLEDIEGQTQRVLAAMRTHRWWTKTRLAQVVKGSPHAMSARMSDLRHAGAIIEKRYAGDGLYLYRMVRP